MEKFYKFQTYLYELSILVEALPQDGCDLMPDDNTTLVSSNSTTQAPKVRQQTAQKQGIELANSLLVLPIKSYSKTREMHYRFQNVNWSCIQNHSQGR